MAKSTIQLDYFKTLQEWLLKSLEYNTIQMENSKDGENNTNMRSFYHGEVNAIETMLRKLHQLKAIELRQEKEEE